MELHKGDKYKDVDGTEFLSGMEKEAEANWTLAESRIRGTKNGNN